MASENALTPAGISALFFCFRNANLYKQFRFEIWRYSDRLTNCLKEIPIFYLDHDYQIVSYKILTKPLCLNFNLPIQKR